MFSISGSVPRSSISRSGTAISVSSRLGVVFKVRLAQDLQQLERADIFHGKPALRHPVGDGVHQIGFPKPALAGKQQIADLGIRVGVRIVLADVAVAEHCLPLADGCGQILGKGIGIESSRRYGSSSRPSSRSIRRLSSVSKQVHMRREGSYTYPSSRQTAQVKIGLSTSGESPFFLSSACDLFVERLQGVGDARVGGFVLPLGVEGVADAAHHHARGGCRSAPEAPRTARTARRRARRRRRGFGRGAPRIPPARTRIIRSRVILH